MWDLIAKILPNLVDFAKGEKRNADDINLINQRIDNLSKLVESVIARQDNAEARHDMEQQNLLLRLENILLRHGVTPPPLTTPESRSDAGQN